LIIIFVSPLDTVNFQDGRVPWRFVVHLDGSFSAGSSDALHGQRGLSGLFGDKPVLLFDHGARGSITVEPAKDFAWNAAVGPLRSVFVEHVKQNELFSRRWLSCHSPSPILFSGGARRQTARGAQNVPYHVGDFISPDPQ
jgi:hypothetical protein